MHGDARALLIALGPLACLENTCLALLLVSESRIKLQLPTCKLRRCLYFASPIRG